MVDAAELASFRSRARSWLERNARRRQVDPGAAPSLFDEPGPEQSARLVAEAKAWQRAKFDAGFSGIAYPVELGGQGGTSEMQAAFNQEEGSFDTPTGVWEITMGMVAPTLLACGTPEQRSRWIPHILDGTHVWCQLFSEPDAGSDLGSLTTRAVRDGDEWVISGQKVWTSGAHYASWGYLLARTNPDAPKFKGITAFCVRMDAPGVTVRPLRQMTGGAAFNEVFFDGVRVPDDQRLGEVDEGWSVAITTLMNERVASTGSGSGGIGALVHLVRSTGPSGLAPAADPVVRQHTARVYSLAKVMVWTSKRAAAAMAADGIPGPEGSLGKMQVARLLAEMGRLAVHAQGAHGMLSGDWAKFFLATPGMRIGGGTDEVMRNIVGERVLGLPREPRPAT